jgi:hypothetical protein
MQFATNTEYAPVFVFAGNVATIWVSLNETIASGEPLNNTVGDFADGSNAVPEKVT